MFFVYVTGFDIVWYRIIVIDVDEREQWQWPSPTVGREW